MGFEKPPKPARRSIPERAIQAESGLEARILAELSELKGKVDESLEQGRQCGTEIRLLRKELGLDGPHGRLPLVEATLTRHEDRLEKLEAVKLESDGRDKFISTLLALCGGGAGGALIAFVGRFFAIH